MSLKNKLMRLSGIMEVWQRQRGLFQNFAIFVTYISRFLPKSTRKSPVLFLSLATSHKATRGWLCESIYPGRGYIASATAGQKQRRPGQGHVRADSSSHDNNKRGGNDWMAVGYVDHGAKYSSPSFKSPRIKRTGCPFRSGNSSLDAPLRKHSRGTPRRYPWWRHMGATLLNGNHAEIFNLPLKS